LSGVDLKKFANKAINKDESKQTEEKNE